MINEGFRTTTICDLGSKDRIKRRDGIRDIMNCNDIDINEVTASPVIKYCNVSTEDFLLLKGLFERLGERLGSSKSALNYKVSEEQAIKIDDQTIWVPLQRKSAGGNGHPIPTANSSHVNQYEDPASPAVAEHVTVQTPHAPKVTDRALDTQQLPDGSPTHVAASQSSSSPQHGEIGIDKSSREAEEDRIEHPQRQSMSANIVESHGAKLSDDNEKQRVEAVTVTPPQLNPEAKITSVDTEQVKAGYIEQFYNWFDRKYLKIKKYLMEKF